VSYSHCDCHALMFICVCRNKEVESLKKQIDLMKLHISHEDEKATDLEIKSK